MTTEALAANDKRLDVMQLGTVLARSGYFQDAKDMSQAVVKVLAGQEMGFGPIASMTGIHIVKGKPVLGANLIAAAIKRSGRYDYKVREFTGEICRIEFLEREGGKFSSIGESSFSMDDAKAAGLTGSPNYRSFPRNMLFARAISNGAKWYTPDVFGGPVYTPDEMGLDVDIEGDVKNPPATTARPVEPADEATRLFPDPPPVVPNRARTIETAGSVDTVDDDSPEKHRPFYVQSVVATLKERGASRATAKRLFAQFLGTDEPGDDFARVDIAALKALYDHLGTAA